MSSNKNAGRPYNFLESANTFMGSVAAPIYLIDRQGRPAGLSLLTLVGNNKIKNNILEFTAEDK